MSPQGTLPCRRCGADVPIEHSRCSRCGTAVPGGALADLPTTPGAPLVRGVPRRKRMSSYDFIPPAFLEELQQRRQDGAARTQAVLAAQRQKRLYATLVGAALTVLPFAAVTFVFMPVKSDAFLLAVPDGLLGALCGRLLNRFGGGAMTSIFLFAPTFVFVASLRVQLGYPIVHHPAAGVVLGLAAVFALLVAGFVGVALDEHVS